MRTGAVSVLACGIYVIRFGYRRVACVSFGSMAKLGFIDFGERDDVDIEV